MNHTITAVLLLGLSGASQTAVPTAHPAASPDIGLSTRITVDPSVNRTIFEEFIDVGIRNHIPLGIVQGSKQACSKTVSISEENMSVQEFLTLLNRGATDYKVFLSEGVLHLYPLGHTTANDLLNLQIEQFKFSGTFLESTMYLWTYVRGVLMPEAGSAIESLSSPDAVRLRKFYVEHGSVEMILNQIVKQKSLAIWVVGKQPATLKEDARAQTFEVFGYVDDIQTILSLPCSAP